MGTADVTLEKQVAGTWQSMNDPNDIITISGSGFTYTLSGSTKSLMTGEAVRIGIANISPAPTATEPYSADIGFYDTGGTLLRFTKIPYFVK